MSLFARTSGRRALASLLLAPLGFVAWGSAQAATTYYVRTDGGDASQCNGRANARYSGSGTGQACAWKHPFFAMAPNGTKRIAGGDTLLIGSGNYTIGQGAPGAGSCSGKSCDFPAVPSGPTASARTRILGMSAAAPPRFLGTNGVKVLNLEGSDNVEVGNLEITDQSDCLYNHSVSSASCGSTGNWAKTGLSASASNNVWLHDINIHGMAAHGIRAGGLSNWTVERVKLIANGRIGWDGNIGSTGSSNSGSIVWRDVEIAWNGCGERWRTGEPWGCFAQQTGGYGDGVGTVYTGGKWLIEDTFIHHNTSDGLDLRYMDGASGTHVTVRRLYAVANAGNQAKIRGNSLIENSVLVSNCSYFEGKYYMIAADNCRANGNVLQLVMTPTDTAVVRHNTIAGESGTLIGTGEGDGTGKVRIENNVLVGFPTYRDPKARPSVQYGNFPGAVSFAGNLAWNVKSSCPSGTICNTQNPKLTNMTLDAFDAEPLSGSPVVDRVAAISSVATDFLLQRRPSGAKSDIGAYELQAGGSTPAPGEFVKSDFSGEGVADILWRNMASGANTIWRSGNGATIKSTRGADLAWEVVGKGDYDGNGTSDILWRNRTTGANTIWRSGNRLSVQAVSDVANKTWQVVGSGDFNGDGKDDILWRNSLTGGNTIWKSANAATPQRMNTVANLAWMIAGVGDFNGDGKDDVLWRNRSTGANSIWLSGNSATVKSVADVRSLAWVIQGVGDFDGDGKSDILWRHATNGANSIWRSGVFASQLPMTDITDNSWLIAAVADYDADGKDDIAWRHRFSGRNAIWPSARYASRRNIKTVTDRAWQIM